MPRVSIILPVFNAAGTVARAARSCLDQSYEDLELIIVDDGSTDGTGQVLEPIAAGDGRVVIRRFESRRGVAAAAEVGRGLAAGEFIARMDADDTSHRDRISKQIQALDADPSLAGCGTAVRLVGAPEADPGRGFGEHVRWLNSLNDPAALAAQRFIESPVANPSSMVRAAAFDEAGGNRDPEWAEDYDLWLRFCDRGLRLLNLRDPLLDWHDSPGRLTRASPRYSAEMFSKAKAHYLARLPRVRAAGVDVAGAGPIGKRIARDLAAAGVAVHCFYEVNPRRVGERIGGVEVRPHEEFAHGGRVLLGAVGLPGARDRIRGIADDAGFVEGVDFFAVA